MTYSTITRLRDAPARARPLAAIDLAPIEPTPINQAPINLAPIDLAPIDLAPVLGGWVNYDSNTTGLVRVDISDHGGQLVVRAVGAGSPPVEWPEAAGAAFAGGVDQSEAVGFAARCELAFATVLLAAYLNLRLLVVDAYTDFPDSGRSPYFQRDHFYLPAGR